MQPPRDETDQVREFKEFTIPLNMTVMASSCAREARNHKVVKSLGLKERYTTIAFYIQCCFMSV